jgi:hypothetical protein
MQGYAPRTRKMDAERLNQTEVLIADLRSRLAELRGYL